MVTTITLKIYVSRPFDGSLSDYDYAIDRAKKIKNKLWKHFQNKNGEDVAPVSIDVSVDSHADNYELMNNKV